MELAIPQHYTYGSRAAAAAANTYETLTVTNVRRVASV